MFIKSLKLKNFRSHENTTLELDRLVVVRGRNGSGKSSIAMALEMLLTGHCAVTDARGAGADTLIRLGAKEFEISADIGKETITARRSPTGGSTTVGNFAAGNSAKYWIEQNIAPMGVLSACLNSSRFLEMTPAEQKALLAQVLADEPVQLEDRIVKLMAEIPEISYGKGMVRTAKDIDDLHESYFKVRTQANRDLKNLGDIAPPEIPEGYREPEGIKGDLDQLRKERDAKLAAKAKLLSANNKTEVARQAAEAQKKAVEPFLLSDSVLNQHRKTVKAKDKALELDTDIQFLQTLLTERRSILAGAANQPENCPTCHQPIPAHMKVDVKAIEAGIKETEDELQKKQVQRTKLGDWKTAEEQLKRHSDAAAATMNADASLAGLKMAPTPDTSELDEAVKTIEQRIAKGEAILSTATTIAGAIAQHKQVSAKKDMLAKKSALLDELVDAFGDKGGLKAKLVGGKLPAFVQRMNQVLARFGFACEFSLNPYKLGITSPNWQPGTTLELGQLSESEGFRFAIAFQIALAETTGVKFVMVDRADQLTPESRQFLTEALLSSELEQSIILSTAEPTGEAPAIEGVAFYELASENGTTRAQRIGESVEA